MSEKINIFNNLDELRKTNLLDQLKSLKPDESINLNDSQGFDNDDFDFDTIVNNNTVKSPTKRHVKKDCSATPEKKSKKKRNGRRESTSTDRSLSPPLLLLQNLDTTNNLPVGRRTRSGAKLAEKVLENYEPSPVIERGKGKGTGRGRGRGRGKGGNSVNQSVNSIDDSSDFQQNSSTSSQLSSNQVPEDEINQNNSTLTGRGRGRGRKRGKGRNNVRQSVSSITDSSDLQQNSSTSFLQLSSNQVPEIEINQNNPTLSIMERFLQLGANIGRSRVMRARRQYFAEIAARSTQVDYIDLVSSPMPRVEGFIDLDSYTEDEPQRTTRGRKKKQEQIIFKPNNNSEAINPALGISFEEDNPELNIKVNWKGKPEAFKLRKHQKFSSIFEQISKRENINIDDIVFNLNNRIIMADDTPDTINYKIFHFIDGRVLTSSLTSPRAPMAAGKKRDSNKITLKIQSDKWKRPLQIDIMKTDKFRILYIKCAEELKIGLDQLKLSFDGELLELNDTPTDLELEGGEAIDLRIKN